MNLTGGARMQPCSNCPASKAVALLLALCSQLHCRPCAAALRALCSCAAGPVQLYCRPCVAVLQALCSFPSGPVLYCKPCAALLQALCSYTASILQARCSANASPEQLYCKPHAAFLQALCNCTAGPMPLLAFGLNETTISVPFRTRPCLSVPPRTGLYFL